MMISRLASRLSSTPKWWRGIPALLAVLVLVSSMASAQQLTATISGFVADTSEARIPGAQLTVKSESTGDVRTTHADGSGFFSVTALIPGTYTVTVTANGFTTWRENGVVLNQGDSRTLPNIRLKVGGASTDVTVISGQDAEIPIDNAEISMTLNNDLIDSATLTGRDAAELIKFMPGVAFNNGGGAGSGYDSKTTGTNNGPAGNFSANGTQPYGALALILDGANLIDPGNAGTQIANINQDMTESVKFLSASYGAEYAKGPAVLQAFSKSGNQHFHGEAYLYSRNSAWGYANDAFNKAQGNPIRPQSYYYIGGNVGGPVVIPGLGFNKNRDKMFFWGGYEKMIQHPYNAPLSMNVPTAAQLGGDFNNTGVPADVINTFNFAYARPCPAVVSWNGCNSTNSPWAGYGSEPVPNLEKAGPFDADGVIIANLMPKANITPSKTNGWNNYQFVNDKPVNRWEGTGKLTYSFNDSNKLWGSYAYQSEKDFHPVAIWWASPWTLPYPSESTANATAQVALVNYTHVFSPTTTNEVVFSYARYINPNKLADPNAVSRSKLGYPTGGLFSHTTDQIPNFVGPWGGAFPTFLQYSFDGSFNGGKTFGKTAKAPAVSDTFTKILGTHSLKAGVYWDSAENLQSSSADYNGTTNFSPWGGTGTGNVVADLLLGRVANYTETSTVPVENMIQHQWSLWAQDSWKASRRLTVNVGLRLDHAGQWYDSIGDIQVWDASKYDNSSGAAPNTGLTWHKLNSKVASSGFSSPLFYYNPRFGLAYDLFGNGKTVIRGGFGSFRYQISSGDAAQAAGGPLGSFQYNTSTGYYGYAGLKASNYNVPTGLNQNGATINVDKMGDNRTPFANTYSFGVAQALPGHTVAEFSYVGSMSRNQLEYGANGHISNPNAVPYGAFFGPDPKTGVTQDPSASGFNANDFRPLANYQDIWLVTHGGFANYNSLQVSAQKQSGNLFLFTNFTFGKVLGTRDGSSSNGNGNGPVIDPFHFEANYGPLAYDHTKVFNASFNYKLPKPIHNHVFIGEVVNGWELSGYTTYQDGSPLQTATGGVLNATYNTRKDANGNADPQTFTMPNGIKTTGIGPSQWFGSNRYPAGLPPILTSDPRKGLKSGQYFNPNAFAAPHYGELGAIVWPYVRAPHYFSSDMALFKAFRITDSQRAELRISAINWLNHPNSAFGLAGNSDQQLTFNGVSDSDGYARNTNGATTGIPTNKVGFRFIQLAAKYYF